MLKGTQEADHFPPLGGLALSTAVAGEELIQWEDSMFLEEGGGKFGVGYSDWTYW